jgi:hypothetical protein
MRWADHAEEILALYESGMPMVEIGERYGKSARQMSHIIHRLGGGVRPQGPIRWLPHADAIRARYEAGVPLAEIGATYNRTAYQMSKVIAVLGFRRSRGTAHPAAHKDWPRPTMLESEFEARLRADGGFPRFAETVNRFGDRVLSPELVRDVRDRRAA